MRAVASLSSSREIIRADMSLLDHVLFLSFVALATYAQTMTGFAFGLVLLGLTGMLDLAPLPMVSNVVSILTLANLTVTIWRSRPGIDWNMLMPAFPSALAGIACGVWALQWMSDDLAIALHWLLGLTIVVCAFMLISDARRQTQVSGRTSFVVVGALSGLLGGLFASGGPPIVYHLYRQPLPLALVRNTLLVFFAFSSGTRLLLVSVSGAVDKPTIVLSLTALPVVIVLTWLVRRYANMDAVRLVRRLVFLLLLAAGLGLLLPATAALLRMAGVVWA